MPHEFRMPDIGEGLTEAEIVTWLVAVGDTVTVDQPIVEVETAKTAVEIPAPFAGTIVGLVGEPGDIVAVGDVLFTIDDGTTAAPPVSTESPSEGAPQAASDRGRADAGGPVRAMPAVRKLAADLGIDLSTITGTGHGGTITPDDVRAAAGDTEATGEQVEPLTSVRRAIADHMTRSWTTIPHVTVQAEIRAEALLADRQSLPVPIPLEPLIALAVMPALARHRAFNAVIRDDGVAYRDAVHLGFAVDTDAGLMVAVIRDADRLALDELTSRFEDLATAARQRTAAPDELAGQTFTISNIGALGGGHGTPIIPVGTSAILSIGRAERKPVVDGDGIGIGMVAPIDLSYDHRLIDGGLGQRFLADVVRALETPLADRAG